MAVFELSSGNLGHIRALSRAIQVAGRASKDAILNFDENGMKLATNTELSRVEFTFPKCFFNQYESKQEQECFVNLRALQNPFKSTILNDKECRTYEVTLRCHVDTELHDRLLFTVGMPTTNPQSMATKLTYKVPINNLLDSGRADELRAINQTRTITEIVRLTPKTDIKEKFLLSAFNSFASEIDQVSIIVNQTDVKFIGTNSITGLLAANKRTTTEFSHKREDFLMYDILDTHEKVHVTLPLKLLKFFLMFVEMNKPNTLPKYIFEGMARPAHFMYESEYFKAHFTSSTQTDYVPINIHEPEILLAITGPDESFVVDEDEINDHLNNQNEDNYEPYDKDVDEIDDDSTGYNDEQSNDGSQNSEYLDGNLDGLRSEISEKREFDLARVRQIFDYDADPDDIENVVIDYGSDESLD